MSKLFDDPMDDAMAEAWQGQTNATAVAVRLESILNDGVQARTDWAEPVLRHALLDGLAKQAKSWRQRQVTVTGTRGTISMLAGVRRILDGRSRYEQLTWSELTWADVQSVIGTREGHLLGAARTLKALRRLAALHDQAPDSIGPADAARSLGTTVTEVVASTLDAAEAS